MRLRISGLRRPLHWPLLTRLPCQLDHQRLLCRSYPRKLMLLQVHRKVLLPSVAKIPPNPGLEHRLAPPVNPPSTFVRASLDFHNVLDFEAPGQRTFEGIRTTCVESIEDFLNVSESHRVGICRYIGWSGRGSRSKRDALRRAGISKVAFEADS